MKWSQSKHIKVVIDAVAGAMKLKLTLNESPQIVTTSKSA